MTELDVEELGKLTIGVNKFVILIKNEGFITALRDFHNDPLLALRFDTWEEANAMKKKLSILTRWKAQIMEVKITLEFQCVTR